MDDYGKFQPDVSGTERPEYGRSVRCESEDADVVVVIEAIYTYTEVPRCSARFTEIHNWSARKADRSAGIGATDAWSEVQSYRCSREVGHDGNHVHWAIGSMMGRSWSDDMAHYVYSH